MRVSLPSRERGLKCMVPDTPAPNCGVAPLAGAWIEIHCTTSLTTRRYVAPLAGAWIEMMHDCIYSMPTFVAPLAGAWIEIVLNTALEYVSTGRSPRGSVD